MSIDVERQKALIALVDKINKNFEYDQSKYVGYLELFEYGNLGFICIYWDVNIWKYFWFDDAVDLYSFLEN